MQLIDLSHTIEAGMPRFSPSWPTPKIESWMSHHQSAQSGQYHDCTCEITEVHFLTSIGTYLDSPYHFDPLGPSIEALELEQLVLPGVVVDCARFGPQAAIDPSVLQGIEIAGKAVLFQTSWSRFWGQEAYFEFPFLTGETALALREGGAKLAGVDTLIVDDPRDPRRPVHVSLLQARVLIVENLTGLEKLPASGFTFHAVPAKISGAAAFPVRAFARLRG